MSVKERRPPRQRGSRPTLHEHWWPRKAAVGRGLLCVLAVSGWLLVPRSGLSAQLRYTIAVDRDLKALLVDACLGDAAPADLTLSAEVPPEILSGLVLVRRAPHTAHYRATSLAHGCAHYALDLSRLPPGNSHSAFQRFREAILIDPTWLLAVPQDTQPRTLEVNFLLPAKYRISAPADLQQSGVDRWRWRVPTRAWARGGRLGIGRMFQAQAAVAGAQVAISLLGTPAAVRRESYTEWVTQIATAMTAEFGRFPVPSTQVLMVVQPAASEVVPWGEVVRAGADGVLLYVDRSRTIDQVARDWVAFHEFSHLLHPFMARQDSWWTEGLATYYQNVLRVRAGQLTSAAAWRELHAGFARGRRETDGVTTLAIAAREMMVRRKFMRVYWSGAAIALLADVELRLRTHNRQSLATVLDKFASCCLPATQEWTARKLMRRLDVIAGGAVFEPLLERNLDSVEFPDLSPAYAVLGLSDHASELAIDSARAARRLREAVMGHEAP